MYRRNMIVALAALVRSLGEWLSDWHRPPRVRKKPDVADEVRSWLDEQGAPPSGSAT